MPNQGTEREEQDYPGMDNQSQGDLCEYPYLLWNVQVIQIGYIKGFRIREVFDLYLTGYGT